VVIWLNPKNPRALQRGGVGTWNKKGNFVIVFSVRERIPKDVFNAFFCECFYPLLSSCVLSLEVGRLFRFVSGLFSPILVGVAHIRRSGILGRKSAQIGTKLEAST
jgi:hypothetical protein